MNIRLKESEVAQACLTLCSPRDCRLQDSSIHGTFQAIRYWRGLPFPSPGDLPYPGIEPRSPALWADALPSEPPGKVLFLHSRLCPQQRCTWLSPPASPPAGTGPRTAACRKRLYQMACPPLAVREAGPPVLEAGPLFWLPQPALPG